MDHSPQLLLLTLGAWVFLPIVAAAVAFFSISTGLLMTLVGGGSAMLVLFETSRNWLLDLAL